ncbi:MAG: HDOD domain-containing protein [Ectothiorhodospiraceae bacterium]|nr:HDOD domain-containing protein [Ectothiorhodospiraceae bacterium]
MQSLDDLKRSDALPSLPYVGHEILVAVHDPEPDPGQVAVLIQREPSVTARVVAAANSAFCGGDSTIYSVSEAILRLGLHRVAQLVTAVLLDDRFELDRCSAFDVADYWRESMGVSLVADKLGAALPLQEGAGAARLAGMLRHIGLLLMVQIFPEEMEGILREPAEDMDAVVQRERAVLGFDRYQAGAMLLEEWGLPEPVVSGVLSSGRPVQDPAAWTLGRLLRGAAEWLATDLEDLPETLLGAPELDERVLDRVRKAYRREQEYIEAMASLMAV